MNFLLGMMIILTANWAFADSAESSIWYKFDSNSCSDLGSVFRASQENTDYSQTRFSLSIEKRLAVQENKLSDGTIRTIPLKLNQIGKNTYMVTPEIIENGFNYFTIVLAEDSGSLTANHNDNMQASCGGGLVVTTFVRETSVAL